jgi:hypothetical protein
MMPRSSPLAAQHVQRYPPVINYVALSLSTGMILSIREVSTARVTMSDE